MTTIGISAVTRRRQRNCFDELVDRINRHDWVRVAGTGLATSPLAVLYWLSGAVDSAAEESPRGTTDDGLDWHVVTVSVPKAIDLGGADVRDSFEQARVSQDLVRLHVGLDRGRLAGVTWSDRSDFVADHRFWPTARHRLIPLPEAVEQRALADYFVLLGERNPLAEPRDSTYPEIGNSRTASPGRCCGPALQPRHGRDLKPWSSLIVPSLRSHVWPPESSRRPRTEPV